MRFGSFQIWKCHEQIDSRGSTEFDSQDVEKIVQIINNEARENFETLRLEIVEVRTRLEKLETVVNQYFDEVHNNYMELDNKLDAQANQFKTAINGVSEKVDIGMATMMIQNSRVERKIDRIGTRVLNWWWKI